MFQKKWNQRECGFGFDFVALMFQRDMIEALDDRRDYGEVDGLVLHVVFADRSDVRRIISARLADRKE